MASSKGPAAKKNFFQDFSRQLAMAKRQNSIVGILSSGQKAKAQASPALTSGMSPMHRMLTQLTTKKGGLGKLSAASPEAVAGSASDRG